MIVKEFAGQEDDEEVIFIIHKHWALLFRALFWFILSLLGLFVIWRIFLFSWVSAGAFFVWFLAFGTYLFYEWFNWYRDIYILTNQRIIEHEQISFFRKKVAEAPLENIQDVSYEVKGFWGTILRYGTIIIQTAGSEPNIDLDYINRPARLIEQINQVRKYIIKDRISSKDMTAREFIDYMIKQKQEAEAEVEEEEEDK